ncbi:MAG: HU family DNA-binding protein [Candidatus Caenarcaniphilales bacterium]|nr:HU family DNA-binding protein [Candidatus Caenarcaniphilales bacterium]
MNKSELIDAIAENSGLTKKDAEKSLNATLEAIMKALGKGEEVSIPNFGSFKVKKRAQREGRNPKTGEKINIPARNAVTFAAGKHLRESV